MAGSAQRNRMPLLRIGGGVTGSVIFSCMVLLLSGAADMEGDRRNGGTAIAEWRLRRLRSCDVIGTDLV